MALPSAKKVKLDWGVPVAICIAQAALESGWGKSVKGNAYFGIKGKSPSGATTTFTTTEFEKGKKITIQDSFRAYKDFAESADDYGRMLKSNSRYAGCFAHSNDPLKFADALQAAGYATDPNYAKRSSKSSGLTGWQSMTNNWRNMSAAVIGTILWGCTPGERLIPDIRPRPLHRVPCIRPTRNRSETRGFLRKWSRCLSNIDCAFFRSQARA